MNNRAVRLVACLLAGATSCALPLSAPRGGAFFESARVVSAPCASIYEFLMDPGDLETLYPHLFTKTPSRIDDTVFYEETRLDGSKIVGRMRRTFHDADTWVQMIVQPHGERWLRVHEFYLEPDPGLGCRVRYEETYNPEISVRWTRSLEAERQAYGRILLERLGARVSGSEDPGKPDERPAFP